VVNNRVKNYNLLSEGKKPRTRREELIAMKVKVKLMSIFAKYSKAGDDGLTSVKEGGSISDLVAELGMPRKLVRIIAVNGKQVDINAGLSDGDEVFLFPPAAGGG